MQMFYTIQELKNLSSEELLDLASFGGSDSTYFYSEVFGFQIEEDSYSILFKNGSNIYTKEERTYDLVKKGKARYDFISKSLEETGNQNKREQLFYETVEKNLDAKLDLFSKSISNITNQLNKSINNLTKQNEQDIKDLKKNKNIQLDLLTKQLEKFSNAWISKINRLDDFDTNAYYIKMGQLDKIIEAFDVLLEK